MCGVSAALLGLQTVMQMSAAQQQADAQQRYYESQAKIADQNAAIQKNKASQQADQYAQKQRQLTNQWKLAQGQRAAAAGAGGLVGGAGSMLDLTNASNAAYRQDSMNLLSNQRNDTWSTYINQVNYENEAAQQRYYGDQAQAQGKMAMFNTLLSGAASAYGKGLFGSGSSSNKALSIGANKNGAWGIK